jgi:hypothetical protein
MNKAVETMSVLEVLQEKRQWEVVIEVLNEPIEIETNETGGRHE